MIFITLLLFIAINLTYSLKMNMNQFTFLKKKEIMTDLTNLLLYDYIEKVVILNGERTLIKKDFCKLLCDVNGFNFKEFNYEDFITKLPYLKYNNTLIYVDNFMVGNGRIFNHYEESHLLHIPKTSNLIVFQSDNIETIPIKDNYLIRKFKILQFPSIKNINFNNYIYDMISINNYSDDLYGINWNSYNNLKQLNFEKINILLFEVNDMYKNNYNEKMIESNIHLIINGLISLEDFKKN